MIRIIFLVILFLGSFASFSQNLDSLQTVKEVDSLLITGTQLWREGKFQEALPIVQQSSDLSKKSWSENNIRYAASLHRLASIYQDLHKKAKAEELFLKAIELRGQLLGKSHPDYGASLDNLAILYMDNGNFEKAEPFFIESKSITERILGKENLDYALSLNYLAVLYKKMSNYVKAEALFIESIEIMGKILGKMHPYYASNLNNLANLYNNMGNYEKAEPLYLESKNIQERANGNEQPAYAAYLNNLAVVYKEMGNYEKAEQLYLESKAIREKTLGLEHPDYESSLTNLAILYMDIGNFEKAEPLLIESKTIIEKVFGKDNNQYAQSIDNLANLNMQLGKFEIAELQFLESNSIMKKTMGTDHPYYAISLNNLANFYILINKYDKAEYLLHDAMLIFNTNFGKENPNYLQCLSNLTNLYEKQKRFSESNLLLSEMYALEQVRQSKATSFLSELELFRYISIFHAHGDNLESYLLKRLTPELNGTESSQLGTLPALAFDHTLFYKGFLLTAVARLNASEESTPESKEISIKLKSYRRRLAAEYAKPIRDRKNVAELEESANTVEKELARSIIGYSKSKYQVKWENVRATLKNDEAAIEFVSFKVNFPKKTDSVMYAALVLKSGTKQPEFIPLFEEKSLDSLLHYNSERKADYVNTLYTLADRGAIAVEISKQSLFEILWKPLEKELEGIKTIYFSPSGLLHRINLDAIPISETETLVDRYQLIELNSTRQLVIPNQIKNGNNDVVLYGGIQFEQDTIIHNDMPLIASRTVGELSFKYVDSTLRGGSWNYLAGTAREVKSIEKIMATSGLKVILKTGYEATEESFKNIGSNNNLSPRILHIATHGYFFPDPKESHQSSVISRQEETVFKMSEHPMLRSGLIMAGGNAAWQGKQILEGKEDGILTAYEISQMNLSNTELVVLSACETGLGDIQGNEGVYGLQRAFKIAGAKYLIMSLWQVPDKQTSLLMTTFYKKWLEDKMSILDAFHAAQKELREIGLDPYQWAGFVLVE